MDSMNERDEILNKLCEFYYPEWCEWVHVDEGIYSIWAHEFKDFGEKGRLCSDWMFDEPAPRYYLFRIQ